VLTNLNTNMHLDDIFVVNIEKIQHHPPTKAPFGAREFRRNFTGLDSSGNFSCSCVRFAGFDQDYSVGKSRSPVLFKGKITSTQTKGNA
jgi:hypothetical protein